MNMSALRIKCYSISSGFRSPLSHAIHDSLPLPPPTTIVGMVGAALGISRSDMSNFYQSMKVAVIGTHEAVFQDLTHIIKFASGGKVKEPVSLLTRENLFKNNFYIWIIPDKVEIIDKLRLAFSDPKYALSLGRDDEIIRIDEIKIVRLEYAYEPILENTILPFNLDPKNIELIDSKSVIIPLVSISLPRGFIVNKTSETRIPQNFNNYTFVENHKVKITHKVNDQTALKDGEFIFYAL
jgi:CRISPR-associated protein Cas5 subtype I-B